MANKSGVPRLGERTHDILRDLEAQDRLRQEHLNNLDFKSKRACINCRHAIVYGSESSPLVRCEMGHGEPKTYLSMVSPQGRTEGFINFRSCPDSERMD